MLFTRSPVSFPRNKKYESVSTRRLDNNDAIGHVISSTFGTKVTAGNVPASQKEENEKYENKSNGRETAEGQQEYE
jgi:hypothetical protein